MSWAMQLRHGSMLLAFACVSVSPVLSQGTTPGAQATTVSNAAPAGVAYDAAGNLYIAVAADHAVRRVDTLGFITTIAGTGEQGFSGDGGSATAAQLDTPSGVAVGADGTVYVADTHNHRVRRIANGVITTVAGTGAAGYSGDGGAATAAQLDAPTGLSLDGSGNLYIADTANHTIRKLTGTTIATAAGTGEQGFSGDGGAATAADLDSPTGVAADPGVAGRFYIADRHNHRLRLVDVSGIITTLAGTGTPLFRGDGASAPSAGLAGPRGVAVDSAGNVYIADTDNQRIRVVAGSAISTFAGDGEQGFAGDIGSAATASLDTPVSLAVNGTAGLAAADEHNQRVRSIASSKINTVAGIAPPLTEGLLLSGSTSGQYGSSLGNLTAAFTNGGNAASGPVSLYRDGVSIASQVLAGNTATFSLAGTPGGLHSFAVSFAGDTINGPATSGVYLVNVQAAPQTLTFPPLATPVTFTPGNTTPLMATASSGLPVTYTVSGPATVSGATLSYTGPGSVTVTATQAGDGNYAAVSASQTVTVIAAAAPVITSVSPGTAVLGATNVALAVSGSNFTATSVVLLNGAAIPTSFANATLLNATVPQLMAAGNVIVTVLDSATQQTSNPARLTVAAAAANAQLSVPSTSSSGQQPVVALQLGTSYPVPIAGTLTLSFVPDGTLGVNDPNIQFSTGGRSLAFTIPANSTTVPAVAVQTGTVAGVITLQLALTAQGQDVTPAAARVATIVIPRQAPVITSVTFTQSGSTLTVVTHGYSNTREVSLAGFSFTAAPGSDLATKSINQPVPTLFSDWFSDPDSAAGGSVFTYTQTFNLSDSNTAVQSVGVQLTNGTGASTTTVSPQ